ncbi:MAG: hypothetical protein DRQ47_04550 [Gammaproteobacteria bacterium]|nr:MAG: hypothetical protein DRQ47_04550 [Gammaproteobacteria bacterium]
MHRGFFKLFIVLLLLPTLAASRLWADKLPQPINIVAVKTNVPFSFQLPDGTPTGLYVEFWELWSKSNDIPINISLVSLEESLTAVKDKQAIHAGLFINEQRSKSSDFSLPIHSVKTKVLYSREFSNKTILSQTKDLKVAAQVASFQSDYLQKNFDSIELLYFDELTNGINLLLNGEIQALVSEAPNIEAQLAKLGLNGVFTLADEVLQSNTVHSLIAKGQPELLELVNRGIENIPIEALINLEKKWLPTQQPFFKSLTSFSALTLAEKKWLMRMQALSLGIDTAWYPFDFTDDKGNFSGVAADYIAHVQQQLDIEVKPVKSSSWTGAYEDLKLGKIDMLAAIVRTPNRLSSMNMTDPYFVVPTVIVTRKGSFYAESMSSLKGKKLGLIKDYPLAELVGRDYPQINVSLIDSSIDGFEKLLAGEVDAVISTIVLFNHETSKMQTTELVIAAFTPYKFEIAMAVRDGLEPLIPILNKTFANMTEKQKVAIANNWLSIYVETGTNLKTVMLMILPGLVFLIIFIMMILQNNRRLKSEITSRKQAESDRQLLEGQLHQSQKMEALGKLTGGIAHDFNNMLGVIMGYSELLLSELPEHSKLSGYINQIHSAGDRGSKLTKRLLSFSRNQQADTSVIDINSVILGQQDMIQKTLTVRINMQIDLAEGLWPVKLDKSELEDAILNMSINAMHALDGNESNARLSIRTCNLSLNRQTIRALGLDGQDYVQIIITDNGCGMDRETKERVFEPFFSTKGEQGSGFGLSQVFGFVQSASGTIEVFSEPDKGTQFILYFPRCDEQEEEDNSTSIDNNISLKGTETILVVDDETALRHLANDLLTEQGYRIFTANSANQALKVLEKESIDLLLSDVIMPEMDGYQLASIVQDKYPSIKIQLVSGFTDRYHMNLDDESLNQSLLHKPYKAQVLFKNIRNLLDS